MSKDSAAWQRRNRGSQAAELMSSILEICRATRRMPSVAAKLRLVARYAPLVGLVSVRSSNAKSSRQPRLGGAYRDRTDDLMLAKQPLSQLS
jgi:hypothetical protein